MNKNKSLTIAWLYPKEMNLYGDRGNIIALSYRCKKRGIKLDVQKIGIGDSFNSNKIDLVFFGGGQDKQQIAVAKDLQTKKQQIINFYNSNKPLLAICGGYQLLGDCFITNDKKKILGLKIFNLMTIGSEKRMIGNVVINSEKLKMQIIGFENHSGKTCLEDKKLSLGTVLTGFGNNGEDKTEGIIANNFIGTYMHGPLLPRNPKLADWFIQKALEIKYGEKINLANIDDDFENKARKYIENIKK